MVFFKWNGIKIGWVLFISKYISEVLMYFVYKLYFLLFIGSLIESNYFYFLLRGLKIDDFFVENVDLFKRSIDNLVVSEWVCFRERCGVFNFILYYVLRLFKKGNFIEEDIKVILVKVYLKFNID